MRLLGLQKPKKDKIQPLSENLAIEMGGEILGEIIIYTIAALTVYLEYYRQTHAKVVHELSQEDRLAALEKNIQELVISVDQQRAELLSLTRQLHSNNSNRKALQKSVSSKITAAKTQRQDSANIVDSRILTIAVGIVAGSLYYFFGS